MVTHIHDPVYVWDWLETRKREEGARGGLLFCVCVCVQGRRLDTKVIRLMRNNYCQMHFFVP